MDILGDNRCDEDPNLIPMGGGYVVSDYASDALDNLIPLANGFGFDHARNLLLSAHRYPGAFKLAGRLGSYGSKSIPLLLTLANSAHWEDSDIGNDVMLSAAESLKDQFRLNSWSRICKLGKKTEAEPFAKALLIWDEERTGARYDHDSLSAIIKYHREVPTDTDFEKEIEYAHDLEFLGDVYLGEGKPSDAVVVYKRALSIRKQLAPKDPDTATTAKKVGLAQARTKAIRKKVTH